MMGQGGEEVCACDPLSSMSLQGNYLIKALAFTTVVAIVTTIVIPQCLLPERAAFPQGNNTLLSGTTYPPTRGG